MEIDPDSPLISRATDEMPISEEPYPSAAEAAPDEGAYEPANFIWLAMHQIVLRIGWIFKTETIVMPAFMDLLGGGAVLRGCLPVLNRFGFSVPPVLFARRLKITRQKKWALVFCTAATGVPFAVLSVVWMSGVWQAADGSVARWMPWLFLSLYGVFFVLMGMNQLVAHALQGKLIRANHRGRLMTVSLVLGAPLAITAAWTLLPGWLAQPDSGFGWIFGITSLSFFVAALVATRLHEHADAFEQPKLRIADHFVEAAEAIRDDGVFRRLAVVAALFGAAFTLFPHYQALGRERLGLEFADMMLWVCVQNGAAAFYSVVVGPLADRFGNRLALRITVFGAMLAPLLSLAMLWLGPETGGQWFWLVFFALGMTPVTIKLMANYTLEVVEPELHPRYVSTVGICIAGPVMVLSPIVGLLVEWLGFEIVLAAGATVLALAGLLSGRLVEPRHA